MMITIIQKIFLNANICCTNVDQHASCATIRPEEEKNHRNHGHLHFNSHLSEELGLTSSPAPWSPSFTFSGRESLKIIDRF